jgi:hypothetical protein
MILDTTVLTEFELEKIEEQDIQTFCKEIECCVNELDRSSHAMLQSKKSREIAKQ